jgi:hypothetical protein
MILWNLYIQYSADRASTQVHVLSYMNAVYTNLTHFFDMHIYIILPSTLRYPKHFHSLNFPRFSYESISKIH